MHLSDIVAVLTAAASIGVKVVGLPDQIRTNHRRRSTDGLSPAYFVLALISYSLWTVQGFVQHDRVIIIAQGLGIFTTTAILVQMHQYNKKPSTKLHLPGLSQVLHSFDNKRKSNRGVSDA